MAIESDFKPVTAEQLGLTPEELEILVKGAQKHLPPQTEDGEPIDTTP